MPRIIVVDDDKSMCERLEALLKEIDGLEVDLAYDQAVAEKLIDQNVYQLALVDIELGSSAIAKYAGLALLQRLSTKNCTTLVVSGTAEDNLKAISVTLSAYDFISKPINDQEFINKVQHALKWSDPNQIQAEVKAWPEGLVQDPVDKTRLKWKGKYVRLTLTELTIVRSMVDPPNRVVDHAVLARAMTSTCTKQALATNISNIRSKFREIDNEFDRIHTEPAKGYFWRA